MGLTNINTNTIGAVVTSGFLRPPFYSDLDTWHKGVDNITFDEHVNYSPAKFLPRVASFVPANLDKVDLETLITIPMNAPFEISFGVICNNYLSTGSVITGNNTSGNDFIYLLRSAGIRIQDGTGTNNFTTILLDEGVFQEIKISGNGTTITVQNLTKDLTETQSPNITNISIQRFSGRHTVNQMFDGIITYINLPNNNYVLTGQGFEYDISGNGNNGTWSGTGDRFTYNENGSVYLNTQGYSLWQHATLDDIQVPFDINGDDSTYGSEEIINGGFTNWTGDDPDNWLVSESGGNIVTQNGNACKFITDGTTIYIRQAGTTVSGEIYLIEYDITSTTGAIRFGDGVAGLTAYGTVSTVGKGEILITAVGTDFQITNSGAGDTTFTDISIKKVFMPAGYTKTRDIVAGGSKWNMADALVDFNPDKAVVSFPDNYDPLVEYEWVIYMHGNGGCYTNPPTTWVPSFLAEDIIVVQGCGGNKWGNDEHQQAYIDLYTTMRNTYLLKEDVILMGVSMGGLAELNIARGVKLPCKALILQSSCVDLTDLYANPMFTNAIETSYDFTGEPNLAAAIVGFNPYDEIIPDGGDGTYPTMPPMYWLHGDLDVIALYSLAVELHLSVASTQDSTLQTVVGGGHGSTLATQDMIDDIIIWLLAIINT